MSQKGEQWSSTELAPTRQSDASSARYLFFRPLPPALGLQECWLQVNLVASTLPIDAASARARYALLVVLLPGATPAGRDLILPRLYASVQVEDLDAAQAFYTKVVGLKSARHSPPGAVVFDTRPIPFAVRKPEAKLKVKAVGEGIALWFGCDDADALHGHLVEQDVAIVFAPKDGPFGRYFSFRDPFGYAITPHTVERA